ncbi:MAG: hypothetical protein ACFFD8_07320, partial [Candidatus Thorarchaeota archaeon]
SQSSQELREAGISETAHMKYRRRVKKLEKMQISKPLGTVLLHIGLNTVFHIMVFEPREITEHIFKALQILPFINGAFLENGNGYCFAYTPNQNAVEVLSVLRKSFAVNEIDAQIRASPSWKSQTGFQSPIISTNYDFKKNEWKWNSPSII